MNVNGRLKQLREHYDTLSVDERMRLLIAAGERGDEEEHQALMDSAPKVGWNVKHHFGLAEALIEAELVAALTLAHLSAELFRFMFLRFAGSHILHDIPDKDVEAIGKQLEKLEQLDTLLQAAARNLLTYSNAWQAVAGEWGLDWRTIVEHFQVIDAALSVAEKQAGDEPIAAGPAIDELRNFVETMRAKWE